MTSMRGAKRLVQVERARLQPQLAGLDLGDVQEVGDQPLQRRARVADQAHHLGLVGVQRRAGQGVDDADDAVQRRADLVADIGQEVGLGAVGRLGRGLGLDQRALGGDALGDVAGHAIDAVAQPLGAPFQGAVVAVDVAIAVDEAHHRIAVLAVLDLDHAVQGAGHVVGMDQAQQRAGLPCPRGGGPARTRHERLAFSTRPSMSRMTSRSSETSKKAPMSYSAAIGARSASTSRAGDRP
jgi:hypothetical protein